MINVASVSYAFLIGFVPILIWLGFWLLQDLKHPEPKKVLIRTFIAGMITVLLVIPIQKLVSEFIPVSVSDVGAIKTVLGFVLILSWAAIEEILKFVVAWFAALRHSASDEPVDMVIYMITVALGFAALENTLFLLTPLAQGQFEHSLITGNLRFLGATLIHVLSSATIGSMLAFSFFGGTAKKIQYGVLGVILAVLLHTFFNFTIITTSADWLLTVFASVWVGITFILLMLERIKLLKRPAWWEKMFVKK